jgi:uncharacterized protein (TIGR03437 family)
MRIRSLDRLAICVLVSSLGFCSQASGQSGIVMTVAGNGTQGFSGDGGPATSASFFDPDGVAVDTSGNFFIADTYNNRIRKVSASRIITTVAGNGTQGFSGDGGPATSASFFYPHGVAVDAAGNVFIADTFNNRIRKVSAGGIVTTIAGGGTAGLGDGGPATSASLSSPTVVAVDASGNLFIADPYNNRIRKVSASGIITTVAGNGTQGFGGDGGPATSASLDTPFGVAVDSSGNLFIADTGNYRIRKVSASGIITTVAGNGTPGLAGDGGAATSASLSLAYAVAVDVSGNLFIADTYNDRIRQVSAGGIITTVAGVGTVPFVYPTGVAVDASGNLFIADTEDNRICELSAPATSGLPVAIPLPAAVTDVDVNPNTNQVYVGGNISNVVQNIVWIDGNTNSTVKSLGVGQGLHVNPATNKIYAADLYGGHILVYSGSDGSLLNTISAFGCPVEAVVDNQLNHIWGAGQCGGGNDPAFLIDGSTDTLLSGYIGSGGVMGGLLAVNPATHALYMSIGGVEKEVNASTFAVTNAPFSASVVASSPLAASMYGADASGKNVVVINYGTESVVTTLPVSQPGAISVNPTRNRVYAVDLSVSPPVIKVFAGGNSLSGSNTLIGSIPLRSGDQPCCSMAVNSSSGTIYLPVVNSGSPFLLVIDDTLTNPPANTPGLTSLSPSTAVAGAGAFTMTVNGSGFVSGSVVQWNGAALTTTFVSATQLTAAVPASDIASIGVEQVSVINPGGGASNALSFTIQASVTSQPLSITSIAPSSATAGGGAFTLTVNGSGFSPSLNSLQGPIPGTVVQWNGTALQTTFISSTQLTAAVPAGDLASVGTAQVTVANGASTTSNALPFTISQTLSSYTGCNGQPATGNLQLSIISLNASTGVVQINGLDPRDPNTPFTWNWGDSTTTPGFFPQSHTYSNVQLNYSLQVTSHENDGSTDCAQLSVIFNTQTTGQITSVTTDYAGAVIAQDDFIVIKGTNLVPANTPASGTIWSSAPSFASGLMPTQLGGVSVTVNNKPAFVEFFCSAATASICPQDQLNILTPLDSTVGPVPVVVTSGGVSSPPFTVSMQAVAPSFLLFSAAGYIAATHANNTPVGSTTLYPGSSTPASPGEEIALYAVGFGLPATTLVNGSASQSGSLPVLPVCQVGGTAAVLAYAGLISPGLYQLNLTIPATAVNGDNTVSCTYNGATTPAGDLITVQSSTPVPTPLTLLDDVTSNQTGTPNGVCTLPPSITSFLTTAPGVYLFFDVNGAVPGDMETTSFYRPDGVLYFTNTSTVAAVGANGYSCFGYEIFIAGYPGASYPGLWTVSTTWNNAAKPLFNLNFNLVSTPPPAQQFTLTVAATGTGSGTVSPSPVGTSCGTNCWSYAAGTVVTLTATPATGSTFAGWSGCSGTGVTCTVTMNSDLSVTAIFSLGTPPAQQYNLTTVTSGTGSGTISASSSSSSLNCGANCLSFAAGTVVTLVATPSTGSTFTGWSGACSGTGSCTVTMNSNLSVTATFNSTSQQFILTVAYAGTGSGAVSASPSGPTYTSGTVVTLVATPNTGSTFTGWSGACSGTGSCTVTMNSNLSVTATFNLTPQTFTLTVGYAGTGTGGVSASPTGPTYASGTVVTLSASPGSGSTFAGWSGACSGTGSCTVTMNSNLSVTATFNLTPSTGSGGSLTGTWSGTVTENAGGCPFAGTMSWNLTETGTNVTGTTTYNETIQSTDPQVVDVCGSTASGTDTMQGSANGNTVNLTGAVGETFSATVNGTTITGTSLYTGPNYNITWSYTLTKQ